MAGSETHGSTERGSQGADVSALAGGGPASAMLVSALGSLSAPRLLDLCRLFGCEVHGTSAGKDRLVQKLSAALAGQLPKLLGELGRDELRAICTLHGLDATSRSRAELQASILDAAGIDSRKLSAESA